MNKQAVKKWLRFTIRWTVAIVGIAYVLWKIDFHDHLKVLSPSLDLVDLRVMGDPPENSASFRVYGSAVPGQPVAEHVIPRDEVWTARSDRATVGLRTDPPNAKPWTVVALRPPSKDFGIPAKLVVQNPDTKARKMIDPAEVGGSYQPPAYPVVDIGLIRMTREADWSFLLAAIAVMPLSYLLTSYRWYHLLKAADIRVPASRVFSLNMVGAFYNSFMPGSTGGDVLRAYYAAKHTEHKTRAVVSVLVDRAIGLFALIIVGGSMAAVQYQTNIDCQRVAKVSALIVVMTILGLIAFYHRGLRRATGLAWILTKLPMQRFIHNAVHTMELYGRHPLRMLIVLLVCFPVHFTTIISATFAGHAFGIRMGEHVTSDFYYWVAVPVIALVGAIPISPQGAGVMEFFAIKLLTVRHPVTVGQAVALVMSIRLVQIFWNLIAGLFVLRGGYHAPTAAEQHELEVEPDEVDEDAVGESTRARSGTLLGAPPIAESGTGT